jgi:hypothetical protein
MSAASGDDHTTQNGRNKAAPNHLRIGQSSSLHLSRHSNVPNTISIAPMAITER